MTAGRRPSRTVIRTAALAGAPALLALTLSAGCGGGPEPGADDIPLDSLRSEVEALRDSLAFRLADDSLVRAVSADTGHILLGLSVPFVERVIHSATRIYLDDVRLHLEPDLVVREEDEVKVKLGPVRITAGRWSLRVTVRRIEVLLRADTLELAVADSDRLHLAVPVQVREGTGRATIDFEWDAATAASVVCRDFQVREDFTGTVAPRVHRVEGSVTFVSEDDRIVARPVQTGRRLLVQPEPTEESWRKVRELLERQNNIFRCGLALDPDKMEELLRGLLRKGFRFRLPESIFQPIPLPASVHESLSLEGKEYLLGVHPVTLRLSPDALWYGVRVEVLEVSGTASSGARPPAGRGPGKGSSGRYFPSGSSTPM